MPQDTTTDTMLRSLSRESIKWDCQVCSIKAKAFRCVHQLGNDNPANRFSLHLRQLVSEHVIACVVPHHSITPDILLGIITSVDFGRGAANTYALVKITFLSYFSPFKRTLVLFIVVHWQFHIVAKQTNQLNSANALCARQFNGKTIKRAELK